MSKPPTLARNISIIATGTLPINKATVAKNWAEYFKKKDALHANSGRGGHGKWAPYLIIYYLYSNEY